MTCTETFGPNFNLDVDGVTASPCTVLSCLGQHTSMLSNEKSDSENFNKLWKHHNWFYLNMLIIKYQGKNGDKDEVGSFKM